MGLAFDVGSVRSFVRIIYPSEVCDLAGTGAPVQALGVALLADIERRVDVNFHVGVRGTPDLRANRAIGSDDRHQNDHTMAGQQISHEGDAADVFDAMLMGEPESLAEM